MHEYVIHIFMHVCYDIELCSNSRSKTAKTIHAYISYSMITCLATTVIVICRSHYTIEVLVHLV